MVCDPFAQSVWLCFPRTAHGPWLFPVDCLFCGCGPWARQGNTSSGPPELDRQLWLSIRELAFYSIEVGIPSAHTQYFTLQQRELERIKGQKEEGVSNWTVGLERDSGLWATTCSPAQVTAAAEAKVLGHLRECPLQLGGVFFCTCTRLGQCLCGLRDLSGGT